MKKIIVLFLSLFFVVPAYTTDISSFPWSMTSLPDNRYDCGGTPGGCGAYVTWRSSGGWDDGAYVEIGPPTSQGASVNGEYSGLGAFGLTGSAASPTELHIRMVLKFGADYGDAEDACSSWGNKFIIVTLNGTTNRPMLIMETSESYKSLGVRDENQCDEHWEGSGQCYPGSNSTVKYRDGFEGEWIAIEFKIDVPNDTVTLYGWTQDGTTLTGQLITDTFTTDATSVNYIEGIGWYWNGCLDSGTGTADSRSLKVSDLTFSDSYIGPPAGFVGGEPEPPANAIQGVSISNLNVTENLTAWNRTDNLR